MSEPDPQRAVIPREVVGQVVQRGMASQLLHGLAEREGLPDEPRARLPRRQVVPLDVRRGDGRVAPGLLELRLDLLLAAEDDPPLDRGDPPAPVPVLDDLAVLQACRRPDDRYGPGPSAPLLSFWLLLLSVGAQQRVGIRVAGVG